MEQKQPREAPVREGGHVSSRSQGGAVRVRVTAGEGAGEGEGEGKV
jgi:hypothetical protein